MICQIKRNLKLFFKNKTLVFFSFLSSLIMIFIYIVFLGNLIIDSTYTEFIKANLVDKAQQENFKLIVQFTMDTWALSGIIALASFSPIFSSFAIILEDKESNIIKDFIISKLSPFKRSMAYIISTFILTMSVSLILFVIMLIYIAIRSKGLYFPSIQAIILTLLSLSFSVIVSIIFIYMLTQMIKTQKSFSVISALFSAFSGFVSGVYIPYGNIGDIAPVTLAFPIMHQTRLIRMTMMDQKLFENFESFISNKYVNSADLVEALKGKLGYNLPVNDFNFPVWCSILIIILSSIIFFAIAQLLAKKKKKSL